MIVLFLLKYELLIEIQRNKKLKIQQNDALNEYEKAIQLDDLPLSPVLPKMDILVTQLTPGMETTILKTKEQITKYSSVSSPGIESVKL
jgi:uncharacterized membrane protein